MTRNNNRAVVMSFAHSCFAYCLAHNLNLFLSTKNTILKKYDGFFIECFKKVSLTYEKQMKEKNLFYEHRLIDDMIAYNLKSKGGYLWACKNYDFDYLSRFMG